MYKQYIMCNKITNREVIEQIKYKDTKALRKNQIIVDTSIIFYGFAFYTV